MKKNKALTKILLLLSICVLALLIYKIISIYAVFHSEVGAKVELQNGTWNIYVNGTEISTGVQADFTIDNIETTENQYTQPGKIAPGLLGSFEIEINPENTNVSMKYEITLNQDELKNSNLKINSVSEVENNAEIIKTAENTYTGIIPLQDIQQGKKHRIKMNVEWVDDGQNDQADTELGTSKTRKLQIPVKFYAIQYLGEEITPVT